MHTENPIIIRFLELSDYSCDHVNSTMGYALSDNRHYLIMTNWIKPPRFLPSSLISSCTYTHESDFFLHLRVCKNHK